MKKIAVVLIAVGVLLSGCVVDPGYRGGHQYHGAHDRDRDGVRNRVDRDRDGDGVRNRDDRRPDNPRRY